MIRRMGLIVLLIMLCVPGIVGCARGTSAHRLAGSTGGNIPRDSYGEPIWRAIAPQPAPPQEPPAISIRQHIVRDISPSA